jgi:protein involved in polysaccharide export with SLBB domain
MDTNVNNVAIAAVAVAGTAVVTLNYVKTARKERAKRREIEANLAKDLAAIHLSAEIVKDKIAKGDYDRINGSIIEAIYNDIDFFRIVTRQD